MFLTKNQRQQELSRKKIGEETKMKKELEQQAVLKDRQLTILEKQDGRIKQKLNSIMVFERYLDRVKDESEEFDEIGDIIARYETLTRENKNLEDHTRELDEEAEIVAVQMDKYARLKAAEKLQLNNQIGNVSKKVEEVHEQIAQYKQRAEEVTKDKLAERSKLAQINFAIFNLNKKVASSYLIHQQKSCNRSVSGPMIPVKKEGVLAEFDDPEFATEMSKLMLEQVLSKFLLDHKIVVQHLLETPHTKKIIERAREVKEISRFEIKNKKMAKKLAAAQEAGISPDKVQEKGTENQ